MNLEHEIGAWDGKSVEDIQTIYSRHCATPSFIATILTLTREPERQRGATWLLK